MSEIRRPTRFYSKKQEKTIAKQLNGRCTPNSGATPLYKGDVSTDLFLVEAKTCETTQKSFSIKRAWLKKLKEEAFGMRKQYNTLCFDFGPDTERFYIIDERTFKECLRLLRKEN